MTKERLAQIRADLIHATDPDNNGRIARELLVALDDAVAIAQEVNQLRKDRNHDNMVIRTLQARVANLNREHGKHFSDEALL